MWTNPQVTDDEKNAKAKDKSVFYSSSLTSSHSSPI